MAKGLDLRRRIKSIKSTRSITKAMQMVSASKMRKAQEQALRTRAYAVKALEMLAMLSDKVGDYPHYLLKKEEQASRVLVLLISANKGLCGSLNTNVLRKAVDFSAGQRREGVAACPPAQIDFITLGKKGRDALLRFGHRIVADYSDLGDDLSLSQIQPITKQLLDEYRAGHYDRVYVVYTHFVSVLKQLPVIKRVVPIGKDILESLAELKLKIFSPESIPTESYEYRIEPSPAVVLDELLPRFVEMQIYQAVLESAASEQSARMVAMQNATDAAGELMDQLSLLYNKLRQSSITQEISEIVGGVEAMKE